MSLKLKAIFFISFFTVIVSACTESPKSVEKKRLLISNQTSFTFNIPINKLKDTLIKLFGIEPQMDDKILMNIFYYKWPETGDIHMIQAMFSPEIIDSAAFGRDYFKTPGTKNNIFLTPMGDYWISKVYYHGNKPFEYRSSYAIEFIAADKSNTTISIKSIKPQIINGTMCCSPHGNYSISQPIQPTTIEEYTLILYIAKKLGVKNMKPLQLPN